MPADGMASQGIRASVVIRVDLAARNIPGATFTNME